MNGIILMGDEELKNQYLSKLTKDNNIASYNINLYKNQLKISDVREIKKMVSVKTEGSKRLFAYLTDATIEAQNSMLKILEELPDDTFFVFFESSALLSTILSRCAIINVGKLNSKEPQGNNDSALKLVRAFSENKLGDALTAVDELILNKEDIVSIILSLRSLLINFVQEEQQENIIVTKKVLKTILKNYQLIQSNNLNARLTIEKNLVKEFTS